MCWKVFSPECVVLCALSKRCQNHAFTTPINVSLRFLFWMYRGGILKLFLKSSDFIGVKHILCTHVKSRTLANVNRTRKRMTCQLLKACPTCPLCSSVYTLPGSVWHLICDQTCTYERVINVKNSTFKSLRKLCVCNLQMWVGQKCAKCDELSVYKAMCNVWWALRKMCNETCPAIDPQQSMFFFQMQGWGAVGGGCSWQPPVPGLTNPHCQPGPF